MTKIKTIIAVCAPLLVFSSVSALAQSISIVSGNGQLGCPTCPSKPITVFNPLVVSVKDATGRPLQGATVTWIFASTQSASGNVFTASTVTDANGQATNNFTLGPSL